jgi:hypothetical protein
MELFRELMDLFMELLLSYQFRAEQDFLRLERVRFASRSTTMTFEDTPETQVHREAAGVPMVI